MASGKFSVSATWASIRTIIVVLLLLHLPGIFFLFPRHALTQGDIALTVFAIVLALFTLFTLAGLLLRKNWALWATLVVVACKATIDLFTWSQNPTSVLMPASMLVLGA